MMRSTSRYERHAVFSQPFSDFMVAVTFAISKKENSVELLFTQLSEEIVLIQAECKSQDYAESAVNAALLAVCVWADEQIMNAQWDGVSEMWPNSLLQKEFFNTNLGGELFYEKLDTLFGDTMIAHDVFALCLAQGFKGRYVFNLEIQELEIKRQKAIEVSLAYIGLNNRNAETFASLDYFAKESEPPPLNMRIVKPVTLSILFLIVLSICLYLILQNQAVDLLKAIA